MEDLVEEVFEDLRPTDNQKRLSHFWHFWRIFLGKFNKRHVGLLEVCPISVQRINAGVRGRQWFCTTWQAQPAVDLRRCWLLSPKAKCSWGIVAPAMAAGLESGIRVVGQHIMFSAICLRTLSSNSLRSSRASSHLFLRAMTVAWGIPICSPPGSSKKVVVCVVVNILLL